MNDSPLLTLALGNPVDADDARRIATDMVRVTHQAMVHDVALYDSEERGNLRYSALPGWDQAYRNATYAAIDLLALWLEAPAEGGQRGDYWVLRAAAKCPPGARCEVLHEAAVYIRMAERAEAAQHGRFARTIGVPARPPF